MFGRILRSELVKLRRTNAARIVVLIPLSLVLLLIFLFSQAPSLISRQDNHWSALMNITFFVWILLILPLYIAVQTALVAALEHAENNWKVLLARPIRRWHVYAAKLLVVGGFLTISSAILVAGLMVGGPLLQSLQPELSLANTPYRAIVVKGVEIFSLSLLALSIQHWIAMRCRSFSVSVGTGIVAMITGYILAIMASRGGGGFASYFPWTLPALTMVEPPVSITPLILLSAIGGTLVTLAGCFDFSRRDLQ